MKLRWQLTAGPFTWRDQSAARFNGDIQRRIYMSDKSNIKPLSIALGTLVSVSLANINLAVAAENPFSMEPLSSG